MRRELAVLALASLLLLAGCTGSGGGLAGDAGGAPTGTAPPEGTPVAEAEKNDGQAEGAGDVAAGAATNRKLIRTATIELRVQDFDAAASNLTRMARSGGGWVQSRHREVRTVDGKEYTVGQLVLRVPAKDFSSYFQRVQGEGEVQSASTNTKDVTDQLVDIEARLENLRAERDRLRELYEEANETEDVLRVERRLTEVQGEIERLEARQRNLQNRVAFATITVHLSEPRPEPPEEPPAPKWYDTPIVSAFLESVDGVATTLRALSVAFAYVAPYLAVFGTPAVAVAYAVRNGGLNRPRIPWLDGGDGDSDRENGDGGGGGGEDGGGGDGEDVDGGGGEVDDEQR